MTEGSAAALLKAMPKKLPFPSWALQLLKLAHLSPESLLCFANEELERQILCWKLGKFEVGKACSVKIIAPNYLRASANMEIRLFAVERLDIQIDFFMKEINISTCKHYPDG